MGFVESYHPRPRFVTLEQIIVIYSIILTYVECDQGMFGEDCSLACNCKSGNCSKVSGQCSETGCVSGFHKQSCSEGNCRACFCLMMHCFNNMQKFILFYKVPMNYVIAV